MPTKIEWTDEVWNPVTGCTPISSGCNNCYAQRMTNRLRGRCGYSKDKPFEITLRPERLEQPFRWRKPRRIFVCSMGDLFHRDVPFEFIGAVFGVMAANPRHVFQVLTKRPSRMYDFFQWIQSPERHHPYAWVFNPSLECASQLLAHEPDGASPIHCTWGPNPDAPWPLLNVWLGTSIEDQKTADERIPWMIGCSAVKRFVSAEPLLDQIDLQYAAFNGADSLQSLAGIDWVICGAETGPSARPMDLDWARLLRDQCVAADVPFFFKRDSNGNRTLDGKIWNEMPEIK